MYRLILLDLDGTLLRSDQSISDFTMQAINRCKAAGAQIGISTARGESNAKQYIAKIEPDVVISSGGALVRYKGQMIYQSAFSALETKTIIDTAMRLTEHQCEITVDTVSGHYWNYKADPHVISPDWGDVIYTDYQNFSKESLKISVELSDELLAQEIASSVSNCDFARFSDVNWYKFTTQSATKSKAINSVADTLEIKIDEMIAFGDDFVDIEMLKICGKGVAMGNAIDEVKSIADDITDSNDNDGVAKYLQRLFP